jgi:outer membrane protein insertion porin family
MRTGFAQIDSLVLILVAGLLAALAAGCSNTGYLTQDQKLYTGGAVNIEQKDGIKVDGDLENQLDLLIRPKPNGKLLGLFRFKLWLHNIGFFKETFGEPPVLLESVAPDRVAARMRGLLGNKGYFLTDVQFAVHEQEHTADIQYNVSIRSPYKLGGIAVSGNVRLAGTGLPWSRGRIARSSRLVASTTSSPAVHRKSP